MAHYAVRGTGIPQKTGGARGPTGGRGGARGALSQHIPDRGPTGGWGTIVTHSRPRTDGGGGGGMLEVPDPTSEVPACSGSN